MSDQIHGATEETESAAIGKHIRQSTDHRNVNVTFGGSKPPEPESLSNREIFERLFRLETNAADDRFRIQVALVGLAVLIVVLASLSVWWMGARFEDIDRHFGRIETRMNGVERQLNRMFPDEFPLPYYYNSIADQESAE